MHLRFAYERLFASGASSEQIADFIATIPAVKIGGLFRSILYTPSSFQMKMATTLYQTQGLEELLTPYYSKYYRLTKDPLVVLHRNSVVRDMNLFLRTFMEKCDNIPFVHKEFVKQMLTNLTDEDFYALFEGVIRSEAPLATRKEAVKLVASKKPSKEVTDTASNIHRDETREILSLIRAINPRPQIAML